MLSNYKIGQKVDISVKELYRENLKGNVKLEYTFIAARDGYYDLYNEYNEFCCMDGEECIIDHIVYDGMYDLVNRNGEMDVHFMLSRHDLDIAVFS